jgi:hypothetical protein
MPGFVNYKKGCTRLAAASDKVYQLLAHGRWFSPDTPASSTTKTDLLEITLIWIIYHIKIFVTKLMIDFFFVFNATFSNIPAISW